jgi:hypothetical protein
MSDVLTEELAAIRRIRMERLEELMRDFDLAYPERASEEVTSVQTHSSFRRQSAGFSTQGAHDGEPHSMAPVR